MQVKKIIIADDDIDDREIFERVLATKRNIELIKSVENGREVLDYLHRLDQDDYPDLIVLDQNMPKMNGLETLEALHELPAFQSIAIVIYSTHNDERLSRRCTSLGAKIVLTKPSTVREYEATIDRCLAIVA